MPEVIYSGNPQGLNTKSAEMNEKGCVMVSVNNGKFEHSFIELDDARFLEINLSVTAKDNWGYFKSKVLDKCTDIQWENSSILNLIKLTITGNNSEVKRIISSSIESKKLIRETSSDNLQVIQIDTQKLKGEDVQSSFGIVENLTNQHENLDKQELLDLIFEEASKEIEKEYQKDFKAGNKETFLAETTSAKDSSDEYEDLVKTAKTVAENILNGIPYGGESL
jgi:DNA repair exonuclease SbcCD nuclease subunit